MTATDRAVAYLGREELLERLVDAVAAAADGSGTFVVLRGPAGSGATATAQLVAGQAAGRGFAVRQAAFGEGLHDRPFGALATLLEEHAASVAPERLAADLDASAPALARLAPALRAKLPGIPPPAPLDAYDERLRVFEGYVGWVRRASAAQPLALVLDDLQWADADSVALLERLLRRTTDVPLLTVATWSDHRPPAGDVGGGKPAASPLLGRGRVHELGGLDKGATAVLLSRVAERPVPPAVLDLIQRVTGGQPLPAMELYRLLDEEGHVGRRVGDQLPAADDLPRRLDDIVAWRAAGLEPESRSALIALACFPDGAATALLAPVAGLSRQRLAQALEEPLARGLVEVAETAGGGRYFVRHSGMRRALLALLETPLLARALRRAAAALETETGPDLRALAPLLADLYTRSADEPGGAAALRHCLVAAEQARAAGAFTRAADILVAAARLVAPTDSTARADLDRRLLEAHADAGNTAAAIAAAESLLRETRAGRGITPDVRPLVDAARSLRSWRADAAVARLLDLAWRATGGRSEGGRRTLAEARLDLINEQWQPAGDDLPAGAWSQVDEHTERLLLRDGDESDRADLFAPPRRRTHEQTVALLTMSRDWRRPASLLVALRGACTDLSTRLGRFREAASWAAQYLAAAERYGSLADTARALLFFSRSQAVLGNLDAAGDALERAEQLLAELGDDVDATDERLLTGFTLAHYRDGDWEALLHAAARRLAETPLPAGLLLTASLGLAQVRLGDEESARGHVETVLDSADRWLPLAYLRDEALLTALTAAWERGWAVHLVRGPTLVEHALAQGAGGNHAATPGLALARLAALAGAHDESRGLFAAQRQALDDAGLWPLRAILDHDEGVALAASGRNASAATELLDTARQAFAELGMAGWRDRAEQLLEHGFEAARQPGGRLHFIYPAGLSSREVDVVRLLATGASAEEAAGALEIELDAVARHLASALAKLGSDDPADLPRLARRHGLGGGT